MATIGKRSFSGEGLTEYTAYGEAQQDSVGGRAHPTATLSYLHERELPRSESDRDYSGQMFRHTPGEVQNAFAHPDMAKHMPTLLGMVVNEHRRRTGSSTALPTHDSSLSADSSAMVQNLRGAGVPVPVNPGNPEAKQTNQIADTRKKNSQSLLRDPKYAAGTIAARSIHRVSPEERSAGFQTAKDVLRQARTPVTSPHQFAEQHEQLKLL